MTDDMWAMDNACDVHQEMNCTYRYANVEHQNIYNETAGRIRAAARWGMLQDAVVVTYKVAVRH